MPTTSYTIKLLTAIFFVTPIFAYSEFRVATVDINRVINEAKEAKVSKSALDKKTAEAKKKLDEQDKIIKKMEDDLRSKNISDDSKEMEVYQTKRRDFMRLVKDTEDSLKAEFLKINRALSEKALSVVSQYAKKQKIDLVLDKGGEIRGPVVFGSSTADITDAVIKEING